MLGVAFSRCCPTCSCECCSSVHHEQHFERRNSWSTCTNGAELGSKHWCDAPDKRSNASCSCRSCRNLQHHQHFERSWCFSAPENHLDRKPEAVHGDSKDAAAVRGTDKHSPQSSRDFRRRDWRRQAWPQMSPQGERLQKMTTSSLLCLQFFLLRNQQNPNRSGPKQYLSQECIARFKGIQDTPVMKVRPFAKVKTTAHTSTETNRASSIAAHTG